MANPAGVANDGQVPDAYNIGMLRQALRMRIGQGQSCEVIADAEVDECLEAARREINRMSPMFYWGSFTTTPNVQRYSAASIFPNNYLPNATIFWLGGTPAGGCSDFTLFPGYGSQWDVMLASMYALRNSAVDYERIAYVVRQYSKMQRVFKARGWLERDGYVWLDPVPGSAVEVFFAVDIPHFSTVLSIDEYFAEPFFDFATHKACELLAGKQSEVASVDDGGGKSARTAAGKVYWDMSVAAQKRFYQAMQAPMGARAISGFSGS